MSCTCSHCGRKFKIDFNVDDDLWEKIRPEKGHLLCGVCIVERLEILQGYYAYQLKDLIHEKET